ncbi:MAG TPA: HAMP domain-containing sensor histidine kinase [Chitinophagaceae bacterium]|nr:HAMP domain-containing sensor histidine kinase [Chitinophagaceae bacterium]
MNKLRWLAVLMGITILGITGFQLYWLKENYNREKKTLSIKSEITFRQAIQQLQVAKLKLEGIPGDSAGNGKVKIFMADGTGGGGNIKVHFSPKTEIISTVNVIGEKLKDSLKKKNRMYITTDKMTVDLRGDSNIFVRKDSFGDRRIPPGSHQDRIFKMLYDVDSLQDSLTLKEIDTVYRKAMQRQKLNIPFTITRLDSSSESEEPVFNEITVGFAHPITYKLSLGNTFPYLIKRISLPILFSVILLGITILSFVLLYRNLLRQRRLAELKNEFISNITHELKTPIATVGVAIEALKNFNAIQDPQRTKEYLDISSNELQRLSLLVDKVLKLSMFEKKEIDLKYETLNLKDIVDEVTNSLRLQLEKNHARLSVTQNGDLNLQGDRLHLLSVVFNLLDNAIKYSNGDPSIQIELNGDERNVEMSIKDNGIGIEPDYQNKVFEKFFRVPAGDTHNTKGYGLGLSYAAHVVKKHNGIISVDSQPGLGTRFTIILPKQQP